MPAYTAADIPGADPLRDNAFKAQTAGVAIDGGPVAGDRLAELDALPHRLVAAREQPRQALLPQINFCCRGLRMPPLSSCKFSLLGGMVDAILR